MEIRHPKDCIILIADDDRTTRRILTNILRKYGFEIYESENGLKAVQEAKKIKPDLIFMDYNMPGMDGPTAIRKIREEPELKDIVVFVLTGNRDVTSLKIALKEGVQEYILKPIEISTVLPRIKSHLNVVLPAR